MPCNPPSFCYCPCCGGGLEKRRLDDRERLVCRDCRRVLYVNPAVGVAVVVRRGADSFALTSSHTRHHAIACVLATGHA